MTTFPAVRIAKSDLKILGSSNVDVVRITAIVSIIRELRKFDQDLVRFGMSIARQPPLSPLQRWSCILGWDLPVTIDQSAEPKAPIAYQR